MKGMRKENDVYNRILDIASSLFEQKGYEATTTRQIAELAGISRGHLRYYFGKKEELFYSFFSGLRDRKWKAVMEKCQGLKDARIFTLILLRSYVHLICSFSSGKDLEILQGYEVVSKYENHSDPMTDLICSFAKRERQDADRNRISASVEIALIIMYKFAFDVLNRYRQGLTQEEIWKCSARHGLFAYGIESDEIETLLSESAAYIEEKKIDMQEKGQNEQRKEDSLDNRSLQRPGA